MKCATLTSWHQKYKLVKLFIFTLFCTPLKLHIGIICMDIFIRHNSERFLCYVEYCTYKYFIGLLLFGELLSCFAVMHGIMPHTFQLHSKYNLVKNVIRVSNGSYKQYFFRLCAQMGSLAFLSAFLLLD